jgi:hypothetical protein
MTEIIESFYVLYWITDNVTYQDWGWDAFLAVENFTKTPTGFVFLFIFINIILFYLDD